MCVCVCMYVVHVATCLHQMVIRDQAVLHQRVYLFIIFDYMKCEICAILFLEQLTLSILFTLSIWPVT